MQKDACRFLLNGDVSAPGTSRLGAQNGGHDMVRRMEERDAQAIRELCENALGHDAQEDWIRQRIAELSADPVYYLAVYEDEADHCVKGFVQAEAYRLLYGDNGWNIMALAVMKKARRQGIGKRLVRSLEQHARTHGDRFVRLNSRMEREEAHAFYEHLGYACDKIQKRFIRYLDQPEGKEC